MSDWLLIALVAGSVGYTPVAQDSGKYISRLGISHGINAGSTFTTKAIVDKQRPDGSGNDSFYSGHSSAAFTSAGALCAEAHSSICWLSVGLATGVAVGRVAERRHHAIDVVVGALLGFGTGFFVFNF